MRFASALAVLTNLMVSLPASQTAAFSMMRTTDTASWIQWLVLASVQSNFLGVPLLLSSDGLNAIHDASCILHV